MRGGASATHGPLLANAKSGERHYKIKYFPLSVGNIDHLLCLGKLEHPYESRIRQHYHNLDFGHFKQHSKQPQRACQ